MLSAPGDRQISHRQTVHGDARAPRRSSPIKTRTKPRHCQDLAARCRTARYTSPRSDIWASAAALAAGPARLPDRSAPEHRAVPTVARNSATRSATCCGFCTLRANRINPHGSVSRKNARSSSLIVRPDRPVIKALGILAAIEHLSGKGVNPPAEKKTKNQQEPLGFEDLPRIPAPSCAGRCRYRRRISGSRTDARHRCDSQTAPT